MRGSSPRIIGSVLRFLSVSSLWHQIGVSNFDRASNQVVRQFFVIPSHLSKRLNYVLRQSGTRC